MMTIEHLVGALGWTLVHFLWQGLVVALLLGAAMSVMRAATSRYLLATVALVLLVVGSAVTFSISLRAGSADPSQSSSEQALLGEKSGGVVEPAGELSNVEGAFASDGAGKMAANVPELVGVVSPDVSDGPASWQIWLVGFWLVGVALSRCGSFWIGGQHSP